ncbi:hypothetical protein NDR89_08880 [Cupriavidus gilardii]|uniref:Uncharacterized protein n=1 Tax=Cupriavidus gilardii TaxID=82541 RepID=A0ABY4VJM5_9BURK|nr:hypothetical protein [Cupriavidus gilardii]USE77347.1 hypothetical protein NDR89_08880 [Cupriavidus gilardii]
MFTVLKSWLSGTPQPLYLSAAPATGRMTLADRQNDEVSIAFIHADVNAPPTAERGSAPALVEIYRCRQSRAEYLREALALHADGGSNPRRDAGIRPAPRRGEARVPAAPHDGREALRYHGRRNAPMRQRGRPRPAGTRARPLRLGGGSEPCLPTQIVHISRCLTELGQDDPGSGRDGLGLGLGIATLAGIDSPGLSRSIYDMGRGW